MKKFPSPSSSTSPICTRSSATSPAGFTISRKRPTAIRTQRAAMITTWPWSRSDCASVRVGLTVKDIRSLLSSGTVRKPGRLRTFELSRERFELRVGGLRRHQPAELVAERVRAAPRGCERVALDQRVERSGACLEALGLLLGAAERQVQLGHLAGDPRQRPERLHARLRRRVPRREDRLAGAELLDARAELPLRIGQPLLLVADLRDLLAERRELRERGVLALERFTREILTAELERAPRLLVPERNLLVQLPRLPLELRPRRRDLDEAAPHLHELALLL